MSIQWLNLSQQCDFMKNTIPKHALRGISSGAEGSGAADDLSRKSISHQSLPRFYMAFMLLRQPPREVLISGTSL